MKLNLEGYEEGINKGTCCIICTELLSCLWLLLKMASSPVANSGLSLTLEEPAVCMREVWGVDTWQQKWNLTSYIL